MKRKILFPILMMLAVVSFFSCDFHTDNVPGDGDFEGFWHLTSIQTLSSDSSSVDSVQNLSNKRLFWSFQRRLLQLDDFDGNNESYLCRFNIADGQITITEAYQKDDELDAVLTDSTAMRPYGIQTIGTTFDYNIHKGKMTLSNAYVRLQLEKF